MEQESELPEDGKFSYDPNEDHGISIFSTWQDPICIQRKKNSRKKFQVSPDIK